MSNVKLTDEQQGKYDSALQNVVESERSTWKSLSIAFKIAIPHVQAGGNIAVLNKVLKAPRLHSTRRGIAGMAKKFLAYDFDAKACKFGKKTGNDKAAERKLADWLEWTAKGQEIQLWINTNDESKGKKDLTPEQIAARSDKAIERMLTDGVTPERMITAILNHDGVNIGQLIALLNAMAQPVAVAANG